MFRNILIPISSEYYTKDVLERGVFLAEKFNSSVSLLYIIEKKTLIQTDKLLDTYRTSYEKIETKKEIINKQKQAADNIVFEDAKYFFKNKQITFEEKILEGEYSEVIKREISEKDHDLILMSFEKECMLNYRILDEVDVPIWIESGKKNSESILAVCSNLAPNQKVPPISEELSKTLGWKLHMLYVVDLEDNVRVDEMGHRSEKQPERNLIFVGEKFVNEMKSKGIETTLVKGSLEKETITAADELNAGLIIIGREQKKKGIFGLPTKGAKRKIVEKCDYSILLIN